MPAERRAGTPAAVVAALTIIQLGAIAVFDVAARELPLNDDWVYAEPAVRLATGHGLRLFPEVAVPAIPQIVLGAAAWALHPSMALLRLEALLFATAAVALVVVLSINLGADIFWALLAGGALAAYPIFAGVSASFMTEPMYLALLLGSAVLGLAWIRDGRCTAWLLPVLLVAALDRQHALGIPAALTVAVLMMGSRRERRDLVLLAGCWLVTGAGLVFPVIANLATPRMGFRVSTAGHSSLNLVLPALAYTPRLLGLLAVPFGLVLARVAWEDRPGLPVLLVTLATAGLGLLSLLLADGTRGTYLTNAGLGPVSLPGDKPLLLVAVLPALKVMSVAAFTALVAAAFRRRRDLALSPSLVFLLVLALTQAAPMLTFSVYDRYYLPVLAILLPFAAVVATAGVPRAAEITWAAAALLLLGAIFMAGQQDFLAWQAARDQLAHQVMAARPGSSFFGGYETYGSYTLAPRFEAGRYSGPTGPDLPSFVGPPNSEFSLAISGPGDGRPGLTYSSLAAGRIVLVCRTGPCRGLPGPAH